MASNNLKARVVRLERRQGGGEGASPLIVTLSRFAAPDDAFTGFQVGGEFFAGEPGESMDEAEERVAELLSRRRGRDVYVIKPVAARACVFVKELPE